MSLGSASKRKKEESYDNKENEFTESSTEGNLSPAVGCFELRMRHTNSDSPHHQSSAAAKIAKLLNLFRSKSDSSVKSESKSEATNKLDSTRTHSKSKTRNASPSSANQAPHRRFVRVVRDSEAHAPEQIDDNPHIICRYSQQFLAEHYRKSQEELLDKPLPYVTSGHTILKKSSTDPHAILKKSSTDPTPSREQHSPAVGKHATFKEFVEVIEFSGQDVIQNVEHISHEARLHDGEVASPIEERESGFFLKHDSISDPENVDIEGDLEASEDVKEVTAKVPAVDLNRMDGVMRNIFSSVANVHESHASPEPVKIRRVELSGLLRQFNPDEPETVKTNTTS